MENNIDFQLQFIEEIFKQCNGNFANITNKMIEDDDPAFDCWVLPTGLYIQSQFGQAYFQLQFYFDGKVIVTRYIPSSLNQESTYSPDVSCLSVFCQQNGWEIPQPTQKCIQSFYDMWKYMWQTQIIKSRYFDKIINK